MAERLTLKLDPLEKKPRRFSLMGITIATFVIFTVGLFLAGIYFTNFVSRLESQLKVTTITQATWTINEATMNLEKPGTRNLKLVSSIGNIRNYNNIRAYGLSQDGKKLAVTTGDGLEVITLASNDSLKLSLPFAITGDAGELINWDNSSKYFAFPVLNNSDQQSNIILVDTQKEEVRTWNAPLHANQGAFYPVLFHPLRELLLTVNYDDTETALADTSARSLMLTIYTKQGEKIWEKVSRPAKDTRGILFKWDETGTYVEYRLTNATDTNGIEKDYLFSKLAWETEMME